MSKKKKIWIAVAVVLIGIQFIRPAKNDSPVNPAEDITAAIPVPKEVDDILKVACNDCHSNHTEDMWYMNIQPVGWWINHHIDEGKQHLNLSLFNTYKAKRKAHKMEEFAEMIREKEMPLDSYTWMHGNAKLSEEQKKILIDWALAAHDTLKLQIPPEELKDNKVR